MIGATLQRIGTVGVFSAAGPAGQCGPALLRPRGRRPPDLPRRWRARWCIIMLCGLFVGMVLGLQGFDLLAALRIRAMALGVAAALGLLKELGPVVDGAAVCRPRRHGVDRPRSA
jgi:hypothetical protein